MNASGLGLKNAITSGQCRAARGLLDWTLDDLAAASGVPLRTLVRFEGDEGVARRATTAAIQGALEAAGIEFIAENGGGPGVRLKAPN